MTLPSAPDVEAKVLTAAINDSDLAFPRLRALALTPEHFYKPSHALIYEIASTAYDTGERLDLVLLTQRLRDLDQLDNAGGRAVVTEIATGYALSLIHI